MPQTRRIRLTAVAEGFLLMAACAIVSLRGTEWIADLGLDGYRLGRGWLLYVVAPLTAISTLVSAFLWARRWGSSVREATGALIIAELLAWYMVAHLNGAWFGPFVFLFWAVGNVLFAPWWLLGFWIARATKRTDQS